MKSCCENNLRTKKVVRKMLVKFIPISPASIMAQGALFLNFMPKSFNSLSLPEMEPWTNQVTVAGRRSDKSFSPALT